VLITLSTFIDTFWDFTLFLEEWRLKGYISEVQNTKMIKNTS